MKTAGAALISLLPPLVYWTHLQKLFFFHDDWELLNGYSTQTLPQWLTQPFLGEGILPLFKFLWIVAVRSFGGSYMAMIALLWLTHLAIALLFGHILRRAGLPANGAAFAVLMFALPWTQMETLGWSMQWSAQLGLLFFFAAWSILLGILENPRTPPVATGIYALCILAGGLCSARSIIAGAILAVFVLLSGTSRKHQSLCAISLLPPAALIFAMWLYVPRQGASLGAASYAAHYFFLNPLYLLISFPGRAVDTRALLLFGTAKVLFIAWALFTANRKSFAVLLTLLAFDALTAASLGYARSYTELATTVSSRYQYISLLCFAPFAGVAFMGLRRDAQVLSLLASICLFGYPWRTHVPLWAKQRGADIRFAIERKAGGGRFDPSSLTASQARELIRRYELH